jgi:polar amino acid transport system substrate-binding protein
MRVKSVFFGLLISLVVNNAISQELTVRAYTQVRNSANIQLDPEGNPVPIDIGTRLLRSLMAAADIDYEITIAPWARIIQYLELQPNILAYTLVRTEEREDRYNWIGQVRVIESHLYGLSERADELPTTIAQARAFQVGSIRNDAYDDLLQRLEFPNIVHINNNAPWLTLLERGRVDLVPFSEQAIAEYLSQQGEPPNRLIPSVRLEELSTGLYFAMSKQSDMELVTRLRRAYRAIVENGTYEAIMQQSHSGEFEF